MSPDQAYKVLKKRSCIGTLFKEECRYRILVRIGMTICIRQWGSPWGLSRSELRERRFFLCGDGDGGKNSPAEISGWGSGKKHPSPRIPRIRPLLNFLYLKIPGIYFSMHYEIFWLWILYDYAYFAIHYEMVWLWGFVWLLVVKCCCNVFWLSMHYV
jgi:hypothetical protein